MMYGASFEDQTPQFPRVINKTRISTGHVPCEQSQLISGSGTKSHHLLYNSSCSYKRGKLPLLPAAAVNQQDLTARFTDSFAPRLIGTEQFLGFLVQSLHAIALSNSHKQETDRSMKRLYV